MPIPDAISALLEVLAEHEFTVSYQYIHGADIWDDLPSPSTLALVRRILPDASLDDLRIYYGVARSHCVLRPEAIERARKALEAKRPDMSGVWRCSCCGEMCDGSSAWRWNGEIWEHKCQSNHPQHGHEPARYFGERLPDA